MPRSPLAGARRHDRHLGDLAVGTGDFVPVMVPPWAVALDRLRGVTAPVALGEGEGPDGLARRQLRQPRRLLRLASGDSRNSAARKIEEENGTAPGRGRAPRRRRTVRDSPRPTPPYSSGIAAPRKPISAQALPERAVVGLVALQHRAHRGRRAVTARNRRASSRSCFCSSEKSKFMKAPSRLAQHRATRSFRHIPSRCPPCSARSILSTVSRFRRGGDAQAGRADRRPGRGLGHGRRAGPAPSLALTQAGVRTASPRPNCSPGRMWPRSRSPTMSPTPAPPGIGPSRSSRSSQSCRRTRGRHARIARRGWLCGADPARPGEQGGDRRPVPWVAVEPPGQPWPKMPGKAQGADRSISCGSTRNVGEFSTEQWRISCQLTAGESPGHRWPQLAPTPRCRRTRRLAEANPYSSPTASPATVSTVAARARWAPISGPR